MHLAKDFNAVCETEFPARAIAEHLIRANCSLEPNEIQRRKSMILATKTMLAELKELLSNDRSPICSSRPQPILDNAIQTRLTHFSMVSFFLSLKTGLFFIFSLKHFKIQRQVLFCCTIGNVLYSGILSEMTFKNRTKNYFLWFFWEVLMWKLNSQQKWN